MKKIKKAIRLLIMILLLITASFGLGMTGALFGSREKQLNNEIRIEMVEKKEDEDEETDQVKN